MGTIGNKTAVCGENLDISSPAIDRAVSVLELLAQSRRGLNISEVSRKLGLPKSSTHRILLTLESRNCVQKDQRTGRYAFGLKLVSMTRAALANMEPREQARPLLASLMQKTGLTVHMALLESGQAVLVDRIERPGTPRAGVWIGKTLDANSTAVGKALLAFLPKDEFEGEFGSRSFVRRSHQTITSIARLRDDLARIRELGYSVDNEEDEAGARCVGAPVFGPEGRIAAAISVAGTTEQIPESRIHELGPLVRQYAAAISANLSMRLAL